jgi:hypothetical protein
MSDTRALGQASNPSSYSAEAVKGLVGVNAGRWYYEVKMTSYGQMMIGWCTSTYAVRSHFTRTAHTHHRTHACARTHTHSPHTR